MIRYTLSRLGALLLGVLGACGCGSPSNVDESSTNAAAEDVSTAAHPPIPYVLQYVGEYDGDGNGQFDRIEIRRDGTFIASVKGTRETGRYEGPRAPQDPLKIAFILRGDSFAGTIYSTWNDHQKLDMTRAHLTETLTSPWSAGGEDVCDDSGGTWTDDDPDPATGLYCVCPTPKVYIPSMGGCTD